MAISAPTEAAVPREGDGVYRFRAMACGCEVRIDSDDDAEIRRVGALVEHEALRIEHKFSRYRADSVVGRINAGAHDGLELDDETASLIDYADSCYRLSEGRFDVTSGVLRRLWRFDGGDQLPERRAVAALLPLIGWRKAQWRRPWLTLPTGMEIDLGGIGKEYAVDRAVTLVAAATNRPALVNFGGDLRVTGPRSDGSGWRVAMESVNVSGSATALLDLMRGALTTSGDSKRFILKDGIRYSHILDPRTGWPVRNPPRSVTVAAPTCLEAGLLSTLAMLHGAGAEAFLKREKLQAWWIR